MKTKIGTVKVKRSKVNLQGGSILWRPPAQLVSIGLLLGLMHCSVLFAQHSTHERNKKSDENSLIIRPMWVSNFNTNILILILIFHSGKETDFLSW